MESYLVLHPIHWYDVDMNAGDTLSFTIDESEHGKTYNVTNVDNHKHLNLVCKKSIANDLVTMKYLWGEKVQTLRKWNHE